VAGAFGGQDGRASMAHDRIPAYALAVSETVDSLILDMLEWIGPGPRPYGETMDAWRTSCPRLPVWEDATDLGFIERRREPGRPPFVVVSPSGAEHLRRSGRQAGS